MILMTMRFFGCLLMVYIVAFVSLEKIPAQSGTPTNAMELASRTSWQLLSIRIVWCGYEVHPRQASMTSETMKEHKGVFEAICVACEYNVEDNHHGRFEV